MLEAVRFLVGLLVILVVAQMVAWSLLELGKWFFRWSFKSKHDEQKPITAVLYDSKVGYIVDILYIDKPIDVIRAPDFREGIAGRDQNDWGIKTKNYHFFCIQNDGKHVFIERS